MRGSSNLKPGIRLPEGRMVGWVRERSWPRSIKVSRGLNQAVEQNAIEREHQFWQNCLPAYFAAAQIKTLQAANLHIDELRQHHNARELQNTSTLPV